jgi:hypothetical protein
MLNYEFIRKTDNRNITNLNNILIYLNYYYQVNKIPKKYEKISFFNFTFIKII